MKVEVIEDRCIGCGQCEATCDEVFSLEDGLAQVVNDNIDENLKEDVVLAASGCPTDAIKID